MSTQNIQFHDKIRKFPEIFVFLSYRKNFVGEQNEFESSKINEPFVFESSSHRGFTIFFLWRNAEKMYTDNPFI